MNFFSKLFDYCNEGKPQAEDNYWGTLACHTKRNKTELMADNLRY